MKTYHVFISHSWGYSEHYDGLIKRLNNSGLTYKDYSVPKDHPIHNAPTDQALEQAIKEKMQHASVVLLMTGMYAHHSTWIQKEIVIAQSGFATPKPIIAIDPWGSQRTSAVAKSAACEVVKWQSSSIANAIKTHG